jgi:hypothetical protein
MILYLYYYCLSEYCRNDVSGGTSFQKLFGSKRVTSQACMESIYISRCEYPHVNHVRDERKVEVPASKRNLFAELPVFCPGFVLLSNDAPD